MLRLLLLLTVAAVVSADTSASSDINGRLADLEKLVHAQQAQIQNQRALVHERNVLIKKQKLAIASLTEHERRLTQPTVSEDFLTNLTTRNESIQAEIEAQKADKEAIQGGMDHMWLILCGALVMFMQAGFAMLEAGCVRSKNTQNVLLKNLTDVAVGTMCWWAVGFTFAYGNADKDDDGYLDGGFIGTKHWFGNGFVEVKDGSVVPAGGKMRDWFFQWAFCSAAATIVSGGVAERVNFPAYLIYSILMTGFIYPVVVAWTWGYGWLADINDVGYMDFAGSGIVHMSGGVGALVGAICAGPRVGRWENPSEFVPHSLPLVVFGTFILWFGWYGFNCGSTLGLPDADKGELAAQVAMNTTIAAATGGIVVFLLRLVILRGLYDIGGFCNGILAGLVSITAPCGNVHSYEAFIIGIIGGVIYQVSSMLLKLLKIDDPLDAFPVHGACGAWGVIAAALFDWGKGFDYVNGWSGFSCVTGEDDKCLKGVGVQLIAANVLEVVMVFAWVGGLSTLIFLPLRLIGWLRADDLLQANGMDQRKHSPSKAYTIDAKTENTARRVTMVVGGVEPQNPEVEAIKEAPAAVSADAVSVEVAETESFDEI